MPGERRDTMNLASRAAAVLFALALVTAAGAVELTYAWGHPSPQGNSVFGLAFTDDQHGWAVCGGGTILVTSDAGEHWQIQHGLREVADDLFDIVVTPAGSLVAVGAGIYRSTDGGATWDAVAAPGSDDLRDIAVTPDGRLSAAGAGGVDLISLDDGLTWNDLGPHVGVVKHHVWLSANEAYVVGDDVAHRTTDGGLHWTQFIPIAFFGYNEVYFTTASEGYVVEDFAYWKTTNGGATWTQNNQFNEPLYRYRTLALTPQHWLAACDGEGAELWETVDGGANWTNHLYRSTVGCPCIVQTSAGRVVFGTSAGDLYWTDDFGATLTNAATNLCEGAVSASILTFMTRPDGVLFAANQPSSGADVQSWIRSDDGGATWFTPAGAPGLRWIYGADFLDDEHGVVVYDSNVRYTDDGGDTWQPATLPDANRGVRTALVASDRYFIAAYQNSGSGALLRSSDGGQTWNPVGGGLPATGIRFSDVVFTTDQIGYTSGITLSSTPTLYTTTDGGDTWQTITPIGLTAPISTMVWFDTQTAVAAARNGNTYGIFRTVDGGQHWTQVFAASFSSLAVPPDGHGSSRRFAATALLRTEDGGQTWQSVSARSTARSPTSIPAAVSPRRRHWMLGAERQPAARMRGRDRPSRRPRATVASLRSRRAPARSSASIPIPFNPRRGEVRVARDGPVRLSSTTCADACVRTLVDPPHTGGDHVAIWDGTDAAAQPVAAGLDPARLSAAGGTATAELVLVK